MIVWLSSSLEFRQDPEDSLLGLSSRKLLSAGWNIAFFSYNYCEQGKVKSSEIKLTYFQGCPFGYPVERSCFHGCQKLALDEDVL